VNGGRLERARTLLRRGIEERAFPGVVALVAQRGEILARWALGHAQIEPAGSVRPMTPDTIFDLASVTKPIAGATATLILLEHGALSLDDAVCRFLPEFAGNGKEEITIRHVLTHTTGLPSWLPLYTVARDPAAALRAIAQAPLDTRPGTAVSYSDLGFALLAFVVARIASEPFEQFVAKEILGPLEMKDARFRPDAALRDRIAATERGNRWEEAMVSQSGRSFEGWREHVQIGEVNDGNTFYALDGVSSHAGLFATADDLHAFAQSWLGGGLLSSATLAEATSDQTAGLPRGRGLGWGLLRKGRKPPEEPGYRAYGDLLGPRTYGHTGFTGTSIAIDPDRELVVILLTNRVHPDAGASGLDAIRPRFHNLIATATAPSR
jgi:CubicO group peptidase (beta-lactamase class C family)